MAGAGAGVVDMYAMLVLALTMVALDDEDSSVLETKY